MKLIEMSFGLQVSGAEPNRYRKRQQVKNVDLVTPLEEKLAS